MTVPSEKKCLVILGMHRSGTSALAGALTRCGFHPGKKLGVPTEFNAKGNHENVRITALNDNILSALCSRWNDTLLIPDRWWESGRFDQARQEIRQAIEDEMNGHDLILIKDPRISVLLPLYLPVLEALNLNPAFVISVRNPLESAASLFRRNNLPQEKCLLLWMDYTLKAEVYSRNFPRIILSYPDFLKDPLKVLFLIKEKLQPEMIINPETEQAVMSFLDPDLQHHHSRDQMPEIEHLPQVNELFDLLNNASLKDLTVPEIDKIDWIRLKFNGLARFFNGLPESSDAVLTVHQNDDRTNINNSDNISVRKISQRVQFRYGLNEMVFPVDPDFPVIKLIFKPANCWTGVKILSFELIDIQNGSLKIDRPESNASHVNKDGLYVFRTEMPEMTINFSPGKIIRQVAIILDYFTIGRNTDQLSCD